MAWILFAFLQITVIVAGIRREQREGLWSWSKFAFAIGFAGLEFLIMVVPLTELDPKGRYFTPVVTTAMVIAALNFVWFIYVMRQWRLPDGRTSIQAYRDEQQK